MNHLFKCPESHLSDRVPMKKRGKKVESKRGVNMSFSELVQRIVQRETNGTEQEPEKSKQKKVTPNLPRRRKK